MAIQGSTAIADRRYRGNIYRRRKAEAGGLNTPARHTRERTWGGKSMLRLQVCIYISTGLVQEGEQAERPEARREGGHAEGEKTRRARGLGEARRTGNRELEPETEIAKKRTGGLVEGARNPKKHFKRVTLRVGNRIKWDGGTADTRDRRTQLWSQQGRVRENRRRKIGRRSACRWRGRQDGGAEKHQRGCERERSRDTRSSRPEDGGGGT